MVSDEIIRAAGWDPIVIRMHEESHCGGWPSHHPGMRAATPELVEKWLAAKARQLKNSRPGGQPLRAGA